MSLSCKITTLSTSACMVQVRTYQLDLWRSLDLIRLWSRGCIGLAGWQLNESSAPDLGANGPLTSQLGWQRSFRTCAACGGRVRAPR